MDSRYGYVSEETTTGGEVMELFVGIEETNIELFISTCCECPLSIEPLCNICCGCCGKEVKTTGEYKEVAMEAANETLSGL